MKKITFVVLMFCITQAEAQCKTETYRYLAEKTFSLCLDTNDFSRNGVVLDGVVPKNYFIFDWDTTLSSVPKSSNYIKFSTATALYQAFSKLMTSIHWEGEIYNYWEHYNFPFFVPSSPLHISFFANDANYSYRIEIWSNSLDITRIDGFSVARFGNRIEPTEISYRLK